MEVAFTNLRMEITIIDLIRGSLTVCIENAIINKN